MSEKRKNVDLAMDSFFSNVGLVKFTAVFFFLLCVFVFVYSGYLLGSAPYNAYFDLTISLVKWLLELTGESIELGRLPNQMLGEVRSHDGAVVRVGEGSDGLIIMAFLVASVLAWPGSIFKKLLAACLGMLFVFAVNILRIAALLKVDVYLPLQFDLMNDWILPLLLALLSLAFFIGWTVLSGRHPSD